MTKRCLACGATTHIRIGKDGEVGKVCEECQKEAINNAIVSPIGIDRVDFDFNFVALSTILGTKDKLNETIFSLARETEQKAAMPYFSLKTSFPRVS